MFLGEYTHSVDAKGRLTIPAKFRAALMDGLVVTRGLERHLVIYPLSGWQTLAERIVAQPISQQRVRALRRRIFSQAVDLVPDKQGRILIPASLRTFADIDSEVVVVGNFDFVEVWAGDVWSRQRAAVEALDDAQAWEDLGI